jgi:Cyclin, C-terminal domain
MSLQILNMEVTILKTLDYNLTVPTAHHFLIRFMKAAHADKMMVNISCFILDCVLLDLNLQSRYLPSQLAAAAVMIGRRAIRRHDWSPTLLLITKYRQEEIQPVARSVMRTKHKLDTSSNQLTTLRKKYSKPKYLKVAEMEFDSFEDLSDDEV